MLPFSFNQADLLNEQRDMNIVLAHGILGFSRIGKVSYFNGIKEHLENRHDANVLVTKVDPTASIAVRGEQLRKQILDDLKQTTESPVLNPDDQTHIIAHSMGGLDSRYILSPQNENNIAGLITSLTTIGTPHRGSPIADLFYPLLDGKGLSAIVSLWEKPAREFLEFFGISTEGLHDLMTEVLTDFDKEYKDSDDVHYFWTTGIGRAGAGSVTSLPFALTYRYISRTGKTAADKKNDGVVPLSSAMHGEQIGREWLADHADEVGHDMNNLPDGRPKSFPYLDRYDEIIARISALSKPAR